MKTTLKRLLIAAAITTVLLCAQATSSLCRAQSLPDLKVRMIKVVAANVVTVYVANYGHADSYGCFVTLYLLDPSDNKEIWKTQGSVEALSAMSSVRVDLGTGEHALGGLLVRVMVDSADRISEEDEENNWGELLVPAASEPTPPAPDPPSTPEPAPAPQEKPKLSPDVAAVKIFFDGEYVVGVLENVGDRDYLPSRRDIKDSFKREITLKRIVQTSTQTYTQVIGTTGMGYARAGGVFQQVFKRPKNEPEAKKFTWILTIEGNDPNMQNNSFKWVQYVTKLD